LCMIHGVWAASASVADEIEGKTALTLLSKPVARRDFVLGKFVGIIWANLLLCIWLGTWLVMGVSYKAPYDEREGAEFAKCGIEYVAIWEIGFGEISHVIPGLLLAAMAATVLTSISVALSTRLPTLANLIICVAIYVIGNLISPVVQSQVIAKQFEIVVVIARVIATVVPVFEQFNINAAISAGQAVPAIYVAWTAVYCVVYCTVAMLVALTLFEDRDLA
jgi:ABC-type transport system involved in multi-copper enzyme maturation permease subunit